MLGYDHFDTLAERLLGRKAKQHGTGGVPANDCSRVIDTDDSVSNLIENSLGQFGLLFHGCAPLGLELAGSRQAKMPGRAVASLNGPSRLRFCRRKFPGWLALLHATCRPDRARRAT